MFIWLLCISFVFVTTSDVHEAFQTEINALLTHETEARPRPRRFSQWLKVAVLHKSCVIP